MRPVSASSPFPVVRTVPPVPPVPRVPAVAADEAAFHADRRRRAADVEVAVRVHADGTRISVVRHTVADAGGRRTIGIEAVIR